MIRAHVRRIGLASLVILGLFLVRAHGQAVELPPRAVLKGHWAEAQDVEFSPDGKLLASAGTMDRTFRLWDPARGSQLEVFKQRFKVWDLSFSADGKTLAVGGRFSGQKHGCIVSLFSLKSRELKTIYTGDNHSILFCMAFSPDGHTLAIGDTERVFLWDVQQERVANVLAGIGPWTADVAFSPDGSTIATAGGDHTVRLWNAATAAQLAVLRRHQRMVGSVAFTPDGKYLASSGEDNTVRIWYVFDNELLYTLKGFKDAADSVQYSPDGKLLAAACRDGTVRLYETKGYSERLWLRAHKRTARKVTFSPDGKTLATGSLDSTVKLWNVDELLARSEREKGRGSSDAQK